MKRISELTEVEILVLTDEQVQKYIDYECALEGVPMLPPSPGPEPAKVTASPDATLYKVAGQNTLSSDHATRILDACNSGQLIETNNARNDYQTIYVSPMLDKDYNRPKIETSQVHSQEQWDTIKDNFTNYADRKSEWDVHNKLYQSALKERREISDSVYAITADARKHSYDRDNLRNEFAKYLELAEGNRKVALNFLTKVKDLADFPDLQEEFANPVAVEDF